MTKSIVLMKDAQEQIERELEKIDFQLSWLANFVNDAEFFTIKRGTTRIINWHRKHIVESMRSITEGVMSGEFDEQSLHLDVLQFYDWINSRPKKCPKFNQAVDQYKREVVAPHRIREHKKQIRCLKDACLRLPEDDIYEIMCYLIADTSIVSENDMYKLVLDTPTK